MINASNKQHIDLLSYGMGSSWREKSKMTKQINALLSNKVLRFNESDYFWFLKCNYFDVND